MVCKPQVSEGAGGEGGGECGRGSSLLSPCCPFSGSACDVWSRDYQNFVWSSAKRTDSVPQPVQQSDPVFSATPKWSIATLLIALCTVCYIQNQRWLLQKCRSLACAKYTSGTQETSRLFRDQRISLWKGLIIVDDNSLITVDENGCFTVWANGKQKSGRVDFSPESRLPFAQIISIYQKTAAKARISVW